MTPSDSTKDALGPSVDLPALPYPIFSAVAFICGVLISAFCLMGAMSGNLGAGAVFSFFASITAIFGFRYQTLFIAHKLEARMIEIECYMKGVENDVAFVPPAETPYIDLARNPARLTPRKPGQA